MDLGGSHFRWGWSWLFILPQTLGCCVLRTREAFGTVLPVGVETGYRQHGPHVALSHLSVLSTPWVSFVFPSSSVSGLGSGRCLLPGLGGWPTLEVRWPHSLCCPSPTARPCLSWLSGGGHCTLRWKWLGIKPCASTGEHVAALP